MVKTVAIGDCIVDLVEKDKVMNWHAGGAGLNLAVGLARLGHDSSLVAQIGLDANGMRLERYLREEQVQILTCPNVDYTGVATSSRIHGEPVYHFNAAMQRRRIVPDAKISTALHQAQSIAISSFAYDMPDQVEAFYAILCQREGKLFIDPNPRPNLVRDMAAFKQGFERLASIADFVKLSDEDIRIFYGAHADDAEIAAHLSSLEQFPKSVTRFSDKNCGKNKELKHFVEPSETKNALGTKFCLITLGEKGASLYREGQKIAHRDIWHDPRPIIDTMGAGDATLAAFIHFIMQNNVPDNNGDWHQCLSVAMQCAAATCRTFGGGLQTY